MRAPFCRSAGFWLALLGLSIAGPNFSSTAQETPKSAAGTPEEKELESQSRRLRELVTMGQEVDFLVASERDRCLNVFGHWAFCDCILGEYPMVIGFLGYVRATAMTEAEFREAKLSADERGWFTKARSGRDKCVAATIKRSEVPHGGAAQGNGADGP